MKTKRVVLGLLSVLAVAAAARADSDDARSGEMLPTGQRITPAAAAGASFRTLNPGFPEHPDRRAGMAVTTVASHDGKTLLILTSGFNRWSLPNGKPDPAASSEFVFVYDITEHTPKQTQVIPVPNTDVGIAFAPDDSRFYVSGGVDDSLRVYARGANGWAEEGTAVKFGHKVGLGIEVKPSAAGLAVSADGSKIVVADRHNDAVTIVDAKTHSVAGELDLRPGKTDPAKKGVAGGEYPVWVAIRGNGTAYVSSQRDREIVVVDITGTPRVTARIRVEGVPNRMVLNADQSLLYVASDNSDTVSVIDTKANAVVETITVAAPPGLLPKHFGGATPNSLALSPDGSTLYVSDGGINAVAVVPLAGGAPHKVAGLVPTGWYPNSVTAAGDMLYVVNGRSNVRPNPGWCHSAYPDRAKSAECRARNRYVLQWSQAGFLSLPAPKADDLRQLTDQVAANNGFLKRRDPADEKLMAALRARIKHVIYIVKENRTYDQVLGDLGRGNGDPSLTLFGAEVTPNEHALAKDFVTLDNFMDSGEVSGNGWPWSTDARETDVGVKAIPMQYAQRGQSYDVEGTNRNINVGIASMAGRHAANPITPDDPDLLPGTADVGAPDSPSGEEDRGHLWDAALRAHLTVRNYGFYGDLVRYDARVPVPLPLERDPAKTHTTVVYTADPVLRKFTDPYFRSFDNAFPDFWREREWKREFDGYVAHHNLPSLSLVRFMHDHTGDFERAIDGVNTPELQVADDDYAVGKLIEAVANSPYRSSTLIFVVEDDAQDGPDHVDAHRSIAFVAGPYVKQGSVVSARYSTVNMLRTIEDVLGMEPMSLNDAYQGPMSEIFDLKTRDWSYSATPSPLLAHTALPVPHTKLGRAAPLPHDARYWADKTRGYDWSHEDRIPAAAYDRILWAGLKGNAPYPATRSGKDFGKPPNALRSVNW
ncbi:MAG TPA: bifunctional YncE family protein/alkaline phosphatase family protein [Rhizomicrobium sp.]|nr:bifunctional YncE family protein/alkaline phosphatase family protein [Rhizomicrobium sp.]